MVDVSVVVPVYEDLPHLAQAVESVLDQGAHAVEVVIVDSGDPDAFPDAVRERSGVTYATRPPDGVAAARNHGLDLASGDVIGFCDADDYWLPGKLDRQLPLLRAGADVVYADEYLLRDGERRYVPSPPIRDPARHHVDVFRAGGGIGSRSVLARAACFDAERFDERFPVREDPHLWTRLVARFRPARVAAPLSCKRAASGTLSADVDRSYRAERREIADLCARFPELRPYRAERERALRYRYAKRLLTDADRPADARRVLRTLRADGDSAPRVWALVACAWLPAGNRRAARRLQDALWRLRDVRSALDRLRDSRSPLADAGQSASAAPDDLEGRSAEATAEALDPAGDAAPVSAADAVPATAADAVPATAADAAPATATDSDPPPTPDQSAPSDADERHR